MESHFFLFQSHYKNFDPTLCQPIPLFIVYIYDPIITLLVYTLIPLGKVVMPLSSDFGLVYDEDLLAVRSGAHWVELEVKIEMGKGLSVS